MSYLDQVAAIVGIDWADRKHDLCLLDLSSGERTFSILLQKPEAIETWALGLRERFGGRPIAVCLETRKVPLIAALLQYDFLVIYPVAPQALARYRQTFAPSRAKDDPTDAALIIDLVLRHPERFSPWWPEQPAMRALQTRVQLRRVLVGDRQRVVNRLLACLKGYYPQVIDWFDDHATLVFCQFLETWPTLPSAQRASEAKRRAFFIQHNSRRSAILNARLRAIQDAKPLTQDPAIIEPSRDYVLALVRQLALILGQIKQQEKAIANVFTQLEDAPLFQSLPGAGPTLAPRLLATFGEDRSRFTSAQAFAQFVGVAPVTERSGQKSWVHWRYACPTFLRQGLIEWAGHSVTKSFWARAFYEQQRAKGKAHHTILRALAYKWIRIVWRCWQDHKPYDEATYLMALKAKGSPLVAEFAK